MSNRPLVPKAEGALAKFKMEIANELGISETPQNTNESAYVNQQVNRGGNIGGQMVKRMIEQVEHEMAEEQK